MIITLNIVFGFIATLTFLFVLGGIVDKDMNEKKHRNLTVAFIAELIFIIALNIIM